MHIIIQFWNRSLGAVDSQDAIQLVQFQLRGSASCTKRRATSRARRLSLSLRTLDV